MNAASFTILLVAFVSTLTYAVCFPSLAPFLQSLTGSSSGSTGWLGVAVAGYSLAKVLTAPVAGCFIDRNGVRPALLAQTALLVGGSLLYSLAPSAACVLMARLLLGAAATSSSSCRTWVARQGASKEERQVQTSRLAAVTSCGFVIGPALGGLVFLIPASQNDLLRSPGWLSVALGLICFVCVLATPQLNAHTQTHPVVCPGASGQPSPAIADDACPADSTDIAADEASTLDADVPPHARGEPLLRDAGFVSSAGLGVGRSYVDVCSLSGLSVDEVEARLSTVEEDGKGVDAHSVHSIHSRRRRDTATCSIGDGVAMASTGTRLPMR